MSNKLLLPGLGTGVADYYARFVNTAGLYLRGDTGVFEAFNAANIALYGADSGSAVPYHVAVEIGATGDFQVTVPATVPAGRYKLVLYEQAAAAPAQADICVFEEIVEWDGDSLVALSDVLNELDLVVPVAGKGGVEFVYQVRDINNQPIPDAQVWVTTDAVGINQKAGTSPTDDFGNVTFNLDVGKYYFWRDHSHYNFPNPVEVDVVAPPP